MICWTWLRTIIPPIIVVCQLSLEAIRALAPLCSSNCRINKTLGKRDATARSGLRQRRTERAADVNVVVHIPNLCPACCWVEEEVIWMSIQVKIGRGHHFSARQKSGPERGADKNVIIKIHYARLCCAGIVQEIIWVAAAVELGGR